MAINCFLAISVREHGSIVFNQPAEWLGVLETAAKVSVEQSSAIWVWIMQELRLGPQYFLALREAVQQGRWRTAKNPKTYIKTVAKREALKMGLVDEGGDNLVPIGSARSDGERNFERGSTGIPCAPLR